MLGHDHFAAEHKGLYTGVRDPMLRARLNSQVDSAAKALALASERKATPGQLLEILKSHLLAIDRDALETEDAEHVAGMFEQMLDALGIASSGGALNTWMYGFDPA
jgi:hypothetical protein